jgi:glycosyltransferase involved in cell wall biosynthesis
VKILTVHNHYQYGGGEDEVFRRERELLSEAGHDIIEYTRHNDEIAQYDLLQTLSLAGRSIWALDSHREVSKLLERESPDIAHFHNTFPLISPSVYYACAAAGVPVVQTLHNSRMICPAGTLYRDGRPCNDCSQRQFAWPAIQHACYQESRVRSALVASMLTIHRWLETWKLKVDKYVVFTDFYRRFFIESGIAPEKIALKPHFVECDPGVRQGAGDYALFLGRLSPEKGIQTLLSAWKTLQGIPLKIRGEGPMADAVENAADNSAGSITLVPRPPRKDIFDLIKGARFLVWPSEGYNETFGLVAIEAFACGVPVISSNVGAMGEIVRDGATGLHFRATDSVDLAEKVTWAWQHKDEMEAMGKTARAEFEARYTRERNYKSLMNIYEGVLSKTSFVPSVSRVGAY